MLSTILQKIFLCSRGTCCTDSPEHAYSFRMALCSMDLMPLEKDSLHDSGRSEKTVLSWFGCFCSRKENLDSGSFVDMSWTLGQYLYKVCMCACMCVLIDTSFGRYFCPEPKRVLSTQEVAWLSLSIYCSSFPSPCCPEKLTKSSHRGM